MKKAHSIWQDGADYPAHALVIFSGLQSDSNVPIETRHLVGGASSSGSSQISRLMFQLGQDLQSGDLSSAQQTFASLQSLFAQFNQNGDQQSSTSSESTSSTISVNA
jgi:hypothetical protein